LLLPALAAAQTSPCDLNHDKVVDVLDVQAAVAMWTGKIPCTAKIAGEGICNETVIQRIRDAAFAGPCVTSRSVVLTWTASTSPNVAGYYIYRALVSRGPYTKLNARPVVGVTYTDSTVERGRTYYYVATTVNEAKHESTYSNEATATIP
jgi:hypothetical protein